MDHLVRTTLEIGQYVCDICVSRFFLPEGSMYPRGIGPRCPRCLQKTKKVNSLLTEIIEVRESNIIPPPKGGGFT